MKITTKRGVRKSMQTDKDRSSAGLSWAFAFIFAVVFGGLDKSLTGFVTGAALGVLLAQVVHLRAVIERLTVRIARMEGGERVTEKPAAQSPAPTMRPAPPQAPIVDRPAELPAAGAAVPSTQTQPASAWTPPPRKPRPPAQPSLVDTWISDFMRWFKGGNPLARIGIVILFFGAVFLAKYAAENSLFPIELRFVGLALGALALLTVGWRLREKRAVYAQLLQGGGIAGLYLTVYTASRLYHLLPLGMALALLVAVALAAAILAVAQNALPLAVIGTAGGFLAPIMVSTGSGNHVALFSYYAILNLGVFAVAWFRTWRVLNVLGFLFTFSITGLWRASGYQPHDLHSADFFLILFFLMYVGVSILNCLRQPPNLKGYVSGSLVFGLPVVAFTLHATLVSKIEYALAWSALTLAIFYLVLAWILWRTRRETFRLLAEAFAALGVIFASLAIPLAFDTRTTAAMWAVEGAGLLWLGLRQHRRLARAFGTLLQLAAGVGFVLGVHDIQSALPVLNSVCLGALMLGVAGLLSSYWWHRARDQPGYEAIVEIAFGLWGLGWWLFAGLSDIDRHLAAAIQGAALIHIAVTSILLALIGRRTQWPLAQTFALYLPGVAAVWGVVYASSAAGHPFGEWGESGWLLLLAVHYGLLFLLDAGRLDANRMGENILHAGAYWLIALLIGWEASWQIDFHLGGVWPKLPWGLAPAVLLMLVGRQRPVPAWPLQRFSGVYRVLGAVPLAGVVGAWTLLMNLTNVGDPAWLPYIPLLNPLDVCIAMCLAALALWWTSLDLAQRRSISGEQERLPSAVMAALVFLWLNAALIRALHYLFATPISVHGIMTSTFVQAALSIFWGLLGFMAMTLAAHRRWRYVWIVGAGLMIVVVAKLFLIDLSSIGTVARIASFLSVGLLLLITGYMAPLPPRHAGDGVIEE